VQTVSLNNRCDDGIARESDTDAEENRNMCEEVAMRTEGFIELPVVANIHFCVSTAKDI
jgi:hypothetical protein